MGIVQFIVSFLYFCLPVEADIEPREQQDARYIHAKHQVNRTAGSNSTTNSITKKLNYWCFFNNTANADKDDLNKAYRPRYYTFIIPFFNGSLIKLNKAYFNNQRLHYLELDLPPPVISS